MTKDSENRKCIVSGQVLDKEHLLRFTVLDNGQLIPDFKKKLPATYFPLLSTKTFFPKA